MILLPGSLGSWILASKLLVKKNNNREKKIIIKIHREKAMKFFIRLFFMTFMYSYSLEISVQYCYCFVCIILIYPVCFLTGLLITVFTVSSISL